MSVRVAPSWYGDTRDKWLVTIRFKWPDGRVCRDRRITDARSEAAARRWGDQRESELRTAGPPKKDGPKEGGSRIPTVEAFSRAFVRKQKTDLIKASSIEAIESILRIHILPFIGSKRLDQVTDAHLTNMKAQWMRGGHEYMDQFGKVREARPTAKPKTWNNRLTVLLSMYTYACKQKPPVLERMPCTIELLPVDDEDERDFYDHDAYEQVVEASAQVDPRIHAAVLLGGDGGLRRGEILSLNLTDIDFKNGQMMVRRNVFWQKNKAIIGTPKGGKSKPVPLTERLLAALKACRHLRGERLLYSDEGEAVTPKLLKLWIERAEKKAGLPKTGRLHVYRHTFCSHLAMAGVPARTIQELARHSDLSTTMRYMHLSPSAVKEGIDMLAKSRAQGGSAVSARAQMVPKEFAK